MLNADVISRWFKIIFIILVVLVRMKIINIGIHNKYCGKETIKILQ